jgi:hypothetical protein
MARIIITDAFGLGYALGKEYEVTAAIAAELIAANKAVAVAGQEVEKTSIKKTKIEKR